MSQKLDDSKTGFFDLPPEIRNRIYGYSLTTFKTIHIQTLYNSIRDCKYLHGRIILSCEWDGQCTNYDLHFRPGEDKDLHPNLLATCRTIHAEANPIFYGMNTFVLWFHYVKDFFQDIGRNIKFVRQVQLRTCSMAHLTSALHKLKQSADLDRLQVATDWTGRPPPKMAQLVGPLMRDMHKKRKGTDKKQPLDVLEFDTQDNTDADRRNVREVKRIIRATLK